KSESDSNQRNQAIGALMSAYGYIKTDWKQAVDLYTRQCSIGVNAKDLATMAATLAAMGKNPVTGKQVMEAAKIPPVLAVMATAGAPEAAKDTLGRDTPRGTLLGFIRAARDGNSEVASLYLNTSLRGSAARDLADQLYVVLDSRLPARLIEVSDKPEGSQANP